MIITLRADIDLLEAIFERIKLTVCSKKILLRCETNPLQC
jgi:hypothetical protein